MRFLVRILIQNTKPHTHKFNYFISHSRVSFVSICYTFTDISKSKMLCKLAETTFDLINFLRTIDLRWSHFNSTHTYYLSFKSLLRISNKSSMFQLFGIWLWLWFSDTKSAVVWEVFIITKCCVILRENFSAHACCMIYIFAWNLKVELSQRFFELIIYQEPFYCDRFSRLH